MLEVNKKVEELEKTLNKMADKIINLEVELKEMKLKEKEAVKIKEATQDPKIDISKKGNFMDSKEKKLKPKDSKSNNSVFKFGAEARKAVSIEGEAKEKEQSAKHFSCDLCEYKCEKRATLNKHINAKHTEQKCKVCSMDFKTSMELVKHVAQDHHDPENDEVLNIQFHSTPKSDGEGKYTRAELSESELDDFLLAGY